MITALCKRISLFLYTNGIISEDEVEICQYGQEITLSTIIGFVIVMAESFAFKLPIYGLVYYVEFVLLRQLTGGYHASTYFRCKIITVAVFLISLIASHILNVFWWMYIILFTIGNVVIYILAPIENSNKPLNVAEKKKYKLLSHIVFSILSIFGTLISLLSDFNLSILWFSMLSVIALMIIPKLTKGEKKDEEESYQNDG